MSPDCRRIFAFLRITTPCCCVQQGSLDSLPAPLTSSHLGAETSPGRRKVEPGVRLRPATQTTLRVFSTEFVIVIVMTPPMSTSVSTLTLALALSSGDKLSKSRTHSWELSASHDFNNLGVHKQQYVYNKNSSCAGFKPFSPNP